MVLVMVDIIYRFMWTQFMRFFC